MSVEARLESLRAKHAQLEAAIEAESHRPMPDGNRVSDLKRQKLKVKEELERLHA
ncbi:MAG: YdcH family protein [Alphaproteobacteria bacterium]|nr:YdcH family protein [Alphaproteobacteria bacterium]MBF0129832.1 YdcH family protein [Alphaproteobacteria bacterium]